MPLNLVYGLLALLSLLLFAFFLLQDKRQHRLFLTLFGCVAAVNSGYFLLSVCSSLAVARLANGLSYFGAAYSLLVMLWIIQDACGMQKRKWLRRTQAAVSTVAFLLASSADFLGLYYRSISLGQVNGITLLVKEYGPLHIVYTLYLISYTLSMTAMIIHAAAKRRLTSGKYALFLLMAVLLNVGVWAVEQALTEPFEFLSVSYIVTAVLLLLIHGMLCDYGIIRPDSGIVSVQMLTQLNTRPAAGLPPEMEELFSDFAQKAGTLSSAERRILNYYIDGHEIGDIPDLAFISIHTVKKHNRNIYQKLEVASRDELMLYIELFRCCGRLGELTADTPSEE